MKEIGEAIQKVLRQIVGIPAQLNVSTSLVGTVVLLRIDCNPIDARRVIGGKGAHFRALETIVACAAVAGHVQARLLPLESPKVTDRRRGSERFDFTRRSNWPKAELLAIVDEVARLAVSDPEAVEVGCADSECASVITVYVSRHEAMDMIERMNEALKVLVNSMGKANGRILEARVAPNNATSSRQPESSDGRFSKMVA